MTLSSHSRGAVSRSGQVNKAVRLSRLFHEFEPRRISQVEIEWPEASVLIGPCVQMDYLSDKFDGKVRRYFHEFESPALVFAAVEPQPDGDSLLIIKGQFKIDERGIVG